MIVTIATIITIICILLSIRVLYLVHQVKKNPKIGTKQKFRCVKTMICIGSGGHTSEMMKLIENLNPLYSPRYYIMAQTDIISEKKIVAFESQKANILKIPRSRFVNQSYLSALFTTVNSILFCVPIMLKIKPDLILCNGPGTCIPICLLAFLMKIFFICNSRIVFVESVCRVYSFSLSGKILSFLADDIVVHWEELKNKQSRAVYLGQLF